MVIAPSSTQWRGAALVVFCALASVANLAAQERSLARRLAVVAGPAEYDLAGNGRSWTAAGRLGIPLTSVLLLEPGLGFFTYSSQFRVLRPGGPTARIHDALVLHSGWATSGARGLSTTHLVHRALCAGKRDLET
jgi:hypothetical protein